MPSGWFTHGLFHKDRRLYGIWQGMLNRCSKPYTNDYHRYGGVGITVCKDWHDVRAFFAWAYSNGYAQGLTIDRIDSALGYEPANCRWVTIKQQQRHRKSNKVITYDGKTMIMIEWAEFLGIPYGALKSRFKNGWSPERALTRPVGRWTGADGRKGRLTWLLLR